MSEQPEALRLADWCANLATISDAYSEDAYRDAAAELRRQHARIAELEAALRLIAGTDPVDAALDPQRAVRVSRAALEQA